MRKFYIFASSDLDLWPLDLKFAPQLLLSSAMLSVFISLSCFEKIWGTGRTDGRVQHLMRSHTEGSVIIWKTATEQSIAVSADKRQLRGNALHVKNFWLRHWISGKVGKAKDQIWRDENDGDVLTIFFQRFFMRMCYINLHLLYLLTDIKPLCVNKGGLEERHSNLNSVEFHSVERRSERQFSPLNIWVGTQLD